LKFRLIGDKPKGTEKGVKLDSIRTSPYDSGGYMSNAGYILDAGLRRVLAADERGKT
jgi:hypothetical protein